MKNTISFYTKFGWITASEINNKITSIEFKKMKRIGKITKNLKKLREDMVNFFESKKKNIKSKIYLKGNAIQKRIWNEIKKIEFGDTKTYLEIAKKVSVSPRFVGRVCGKNKLLIVIPCHRVIRSDGLMGGYSANGGILLKKKLINFEKN